MPKVRKMRFFNLRDMSIYTKKGDKGLTGLFNQTPRVSKDALEIETLGAIDEANSFLGLSASFLKEKYLKNKVLQVQRTLFSLGSIIAGANLSIPKSIVAKYEKEIDSWTNQMLPLGNFILPGGAKDAAFLYTARAIVRRAERLMVRLNQKKKLPPEVLIFINRLSDYLFALARYVNFREREKETPWQKKK